VIPSANDGGRLYIAEIPLDKAAIDKESDKFKDMVLTGE